MAPPQLPTVSVEEFAKFQGLTSQRIHQLIDDGMPHRNVSGKKRIVPAKASTWLRERARSESANPEGLDKDAEAAEKMRVERQIKELELARLRGQLVPVEQYEERAEAFVGGLAAVSAGQLHRFERDIVAAVTPAAARRVTTAMHAALMEGAREYADTLEAEMQATEPEAAA
jgi:hypothetical protein